jgi:selenocysteine lyase/cysteine desulfurase
MPQDTTPADPCTRISRLLTALARDVAETEGRELDFETAEQMQRTINAARTELDELVLARAADEVVALAA